MIKSDMKIFVDAYLQYASGSKFRQKVTALLRVTTRDCMISSNYCMQLQ